MRQLAFTLLCSLTLIPLSARAATATATATAPALADAREPTDVYIRRMAGLPAASAKGDIEIVDVGHFPLDTMLSIVANHTPAGWHVSYACAASPHCSSSADHLAMSYDLSPADGRKVDAILDRLKTGVDPGGTPPRPELIGGRLAVAIDYDGFRHDYYRTMAWGETLAELERLLRPPSP